MRVSVNGLRLFFDVDGAGLVPEGAAMREKPTLILLHGGPGADHSLYKPGFGQLSDIAQVVYLDHRGNGRSADGDPADWTLAQWADDLRAFCEVLGIDRPIVFGASFGGVVAQAYATRHPDHAAGLILAATTAHTNFEAIYAAFGRIGGPEAEAVARAYWSEPTPERRQAYFETCLPLYSVRPPDPDMMARMIVKNPVAMRYNGPAAEQGQFDFRPALARVTCPVLLMSGDRDPIMPRAFSDEIAAHLPNAAVTYARIEDCGHLLTHDRPEIVFAEIRRFIAEVGRARVMP